MRVVCAALLLALAGCAVKGYDLGWRKDDALSALLGRPLDSLSGCQWRRGHAEPGLACAAVIREVRLILADLPPVSNAPEVLGARCLQKVCTYANSYQRRDIGLATVLPIYRKVALRQVRMGFVLEGQRWVLETFILRDPAPPTYGPVSVGASG